MAIARYMMVLEQHEQEGHLELKTNEKLMKIGVSKYSGDVDFFAIVIAIAPS